MDKVNKQELRRLAECASSGPWLAEMEGGRMNVANEDWYLLEMHHDQPLFMTDAAFIAAANPAAILSLLDELKQYRRDAERWRKCKTMPKSWWLEAMASASRPHQHGGRSMDAAIDAAMAKEGGANG